jgi:WD40 repeat protein
VKPPENFPWETVAILGEPPRFPFRIGESSHWMAQTDDGLLLAVPCGREVRLFEARTGALRRVLTGDIDWAFRPAFSPDGKRLAAGAGNGSLHVWNVESGREELALKGHDNGIWCVAFDHEGKRLVSADDGGTVKVWDEQGQPVTSFKEHTKGVNHLAFSPDGKRLATASLDGTTRIWNPDGWKELRTLEGGKTFEAVAWSPDGKRLAAGDDDEVVIWDADTYEALHTLKTPGKGLLAFAPDSRTLLTARHDCSAERLAVTRWNVATWERQSTRELPAFGTHVYLHLGTDGQTVFVSHNGSALGRVRACDPVTGRERFPPRGHVGAVTSVAVSADGRTLASGGADRTVRIWDLAGWKPGEALLPVRTLEGHTSQVLSVAFSPNGKLLASAGPDGPIALWDVGSGEKVHDLAGAATRYSLLAFSPDGKTLAAGGEDGRISFWDVLTGDPREPLPGHTAPVRAVAYSPDGRLLASAGSDKTVQLFELASRRRLNVFFGTTAFTNLAFSPDGRTLAAVCEAPDSAVRLWEVETNAERVLTGHTGPISGVAFHPAGRLLAVAFSDGTVQLRDLAPGSPKVRAVDFSACGRAESLAFAPEGRHLLVGLGTGQIAVLRVPAAAPEYAPAPVAEPPGAAELAKRPAAADGLKRADVPEELLKKAGRGDPENAPAELVAVFGEDRHAGGDRRCHLHAVAISPDGKTLAFGLDKVVRLIDLATGKQQAELTSPRWSADDTVYTLAFSPDGNVLACGTEQGTLVLWDVATGTELRALATQEPRTFQVAFSPDGALLAAACSGQVGVVKVWKVATGELVFTARTVETRAAWSVAFSPDGKTLAAGLESGEVRLWEVATGWQVAALSGLGGRVRWLGFHPNGRSLTVAGALAGHTVYIWDLVDRKQRRRLPGPGSPGHGSEVLSGAWRADGHLLITAGATDGTVRLWDLGGARPRSRAIEVIRPNLPWLHAVALSPEGRHLAVGNPDGTVYLLRLAKPGELPEVPADGGK